MTRYNWIKDDIGSNWYALPAAQAEAAARKFHKCSYQLWNYLKTAGRIRRQQQNLNNGIWT